MLRIFTQMRGEGTEKKQSLTSESPSTGDTRVRRREKCVCPTKTQQEPPPRAPPPNQFHTLSPPRHCDVIHSSVSPVAMATLPLGAVHSFTSVLLSLLFTSLPPLQTPVNPAHLLHLRGYSYTPILTSTHPPLLCYHIAGIKKRVGGYKTHKGEAPGFTS